MRIKLLALALFAFAVASAHASAAQVSDQQLADRVADAVQHCAHFTIFDDVSISVSNRNVTIGGRVTASFKKDEIAAQVGRVGGIRSLTNTITMLPLSRLDDDLRQKVARAIYSHPSFRSYASMACPPIHIIVENGRVTLTGTVADPSERLLAYSLAQVTGVADVRNQLRIDVRD